MRSERVLGDVYFEFRPLMIYVAGGGLETYPQIFLSS